MRDGGRAGFISFSHFTTISANFRGLLRQFSLENCLDLGIMPTSFYQGVIDLLPRTPCYYSLMLYRTHRNTLKYCNYYYNLFQCLPFILYDISAVGQELKFTRKHLDPWNVKYFVFLAISYLQNLFNNANVYVGTKLAQPRSRNY